jgi:hypothetical protein
MALPTDLQSRLRMEVGRFRQRERRRRFDLVLHVGSPGVASTSVELPAPRLEYVDHQVRVELISAMLESAPEDADSIWVTRPGPAVLEEGDIAWLAAALAAFGAEGRALMGCYVITREGWVDMRSGERRVWKRLRIDR